MTVEVRVILLQVTNAKVSSISSASGPNSIVIVRGKRYVEFDIRPTEEASEFYKEYWVVDTELYLYLDGDGEVYVYSDDLEYLREFVGELEHKSYEPFIYEGVSGDIEIDSIDLNESEETLRFVGGNRAVFELQLTDEEVELYDEDYDQLFERMKTIYGK